MKKIFQLIIITCFILISFINYSQEYKLEQLNSEIKGASVYTLLYDTSTDILYIGTNIGLFEHKNGRETEIKKIKLTAYNHIFSLKQNNKGEMFCKSFDGTIFRITKKGSKEVYKSKFLTSWHFWYFFNEKDEMLIATNKNIKKIDSTGKEKIIFEIKNENSKYGIEQIYLCIQEKNLIYVVTRTNTGNSIFILKDEKLTLFKQYPKETKSNEYRFMNIITNENLVYAYTYNGDITNLKDSIAHNIPSLEKGQYYKITKNKTIVLHKEKGFRVHTNNNNLITSSPILNSDLFYSTFTKGKNNAYFIGTFAQGIYKFEHGENIKKISKLFFDGLTLNGENINYKEKKIYEYFENSLNFNCSYRDISTKNLTKVIYKLEGNMLKWDTISTDSTNIKFKNLPPNKYSFQVKAKYLDQETKTFTYNFEIKQPYWKTWWFFTLIFVSITGIIFTFFSFYLITKNRKQKIQLTIKNKEREAIDANLKALRSQMNPHFIFNSLNSIQALILKQETENSYDYVVIFSELIRKILLFSDKDFITVQEELEFLETYLTIESLRMKEDFTYTINYTGDKEIEIPSLMIQPFIENAIHHGLFHKKGKKNLIIEFKLENELICSITDNGIGRERSKEINERRVSKHVSFSLEATKRRMILLENENNKDIGYEIIDLYDEQQPIGTRVIVKLPFTHKF